MKKIKSKHVSIPKGTRLPKTDAAKKDFLFISSVTVFAALTIFAAEVLVQTKREARLAAQQQALPVAQLEVATPNPSPILWLKPTPRPSVHPTPKIVNLHVAK